MEGKQSPSFSPDEKADGGLVLLELLAHLNPCLTSMVHESMCNVFIFQSLCWLFETYYIYNNSQSLCYHFTRENP